MFKPEEYIRVVSGLDDSKIDIARTALALAMIAENAVSIERYENHLKKIAVYAGTRHAELIDQGQPDTAHTRWLALKNVIADTHHYEGDTENYDDLRNASLIQTISRRKGLPITLAILYIGAARANGWDIEGLDFPGHFLCRIEKDGQRLIFDPFSKAGLLEAPDLRALVKKIKGTAAELSADHFKSASARDILLRLQNNIKYRQIEAEDYISALATVLLMQKLHPREFRLQLDAGVLYARTGQPQAAIQALEAYINQAPDSGDRRDAWRFLEDIRKTLN